MAKNSRKYDTSSDSDENLQPEGAEKHDDESSDDDEARRDDDEPAAGSATAAPRIKEEPMNAPVQQRRRLFRKGDMVQVKPEIETDLLTEGYMVFAKVEQDEEEDSSAADDGKVLVRWDWDRKKERVDRLRVILVLDMTMEDNNENGRRSRRARHKTDCYSPEDKKKTATDPKKRGGGKKRTTQKSAATKRSGSGKQKDAPRKRPSVAVAKRSKQKKSKSRDGPTPAQSDHASSSDDDSDSDADDNMKKNALRKNRTAAKSSAAKNQTQQAKSLRQVKEEMPSPPRNTERAYEFQPNEKVKAKAGPKAFPTDATVVGIIDGHTLMIRWEANNEEDEIDSANVSKLVDLEGRGRRSRHTPVTYSSQFVDSLVKKEEDSDDDGSSTGSVVAIMSKVPVQAKKATSNRGRMKHVASKSAGGPDPASASSGPIVYKDDIESSSCSSSSSEEKLEKDDEVYEAPRSYKKNSDEEEESFEEESDDSSTSIEAQNTSNEDQSGKNGKAQQRKRGRPRKSSAGHKKRGRQTFYIASSSSSSDDEDRKLPAREESDHSKTFQRKRGRPRKSPAGHKKRGRKTLYIATSSSSSSEDEDRKLPARVESDHVKQQKAAGKSSARAPTDDKEGYDSDMTFEFTSHEVDPAHRNCHLFTSLEEFIGDEERQLASSLPPSPVSFVKKAPLPAAASASAHVAAAAVPCANSHARVPSVAAPTLNGHVRTPATPFTQRAGLSTQPVASSRASDFSVSPSMAFLNNLVHDTGMASSEGRPSGETADTAALADLLTDLSPAAAVP